MTDQQTTIRTQKTESGLYQGWSSIPDHLSTKTRMNKELDLRLAPGQQPVAGVRVFVGRWQHYDLYDIREAIPKRKPTAAQLKQLAAARRIAMTTKCCGRYVGDINWRYKGNLCRSCWDESEEQAHLDFLERSRAEAVQWAKEVLADSGAIILDTETTGLESDDEIIEIAIINTAGEALLDTLVKPVGRISPGANRLHGITAADVANAPAWVTIDDQVKAILANASRIVVYNAAFDRRMLLQTRKRHHLRPWGITSDRFECAMEMYAQFIGDWSDHHRSFRWPALNGGHRALGDCRATLSIIRQMANKRDRR